jgi:Domain of unknown function (DUF4394)/Calx-beta domain/Domain of unknown function (DUF4214)
MTFTWWKRPAKRPVRPSRRCRPRVEELEDRRLLTAAFALTTTNQLLRFDTNTPGTTTPLVTISGLQTGENVQGIDVRPANGQLYALAVNGTTARIGTINLGSGAFTAVGSTFTVSGTDFGIDFNPTNDRLRVVSDADINLAVNPDDGTVTTQTNLNPGNPNEVAVAYNNNFAGATTTTLFGIDSGTDMLVTQVPAAGTLTNVGPLGVDTSGVAGLDISANDNAAFANLTVGGASQLYRINLSTGAATLVANFATGTTVRDIALTSRAVTLFAVTSTNNLLRFNSANPGTILATTAITGLQTGETIRGIDFRPANGMLYAVGSTDRLYTIDTTTGAATQVGTGTFAVPLTGTSFGVDFNPVPDRLRVVSDAEQNLRINPDTGAVVDGDPNTAGVQPDTNLSPAGNVVAAAYDQNFAGATATTLYGIDSASDMLVRIGGVGGNPSPNGGAVTNVGALGVDTSDQADFDITSGDGTAFATLQVGGVSQLYTVNLSTGAATLVGTIGAGTDTLVGLSAAPAGNVQFSTAATTVAENVGSVTVTVNRTGGTEGPATVNISTAGSTATPGTDFTLSTTTVQFAAGETSKTFTVNVIDDNLNEANETVVLTLQPVLNGVGVGTPNTETITITDNDAVPAVTINNVTQAEGNSGTTNFVFTVTLSAASGQQVRVDFATQDGTATSPSDYAATQGTLTFNPGTTTQTITVPVVGDTTVEPDETFRVVLSNPVNATLGTPSTGTGTITNDDQAAAASTIQFSSATFTVAENAGNATITLTRTGGTDTPATVTFTAAAGTARAGVDFTPVTTVVNFAVGQTTATVLVPVIDNTVVDGSRTVNLTLSAPTGTNVSLGTQVTATLTITDNETGNLTPTQCFVSQMYRDLLGRTVDAGGLQLFSGAIDAGLINRTQAALLIESSQEFRQLRLNQFYQQLLRRTIDPFGQASWTAFLAAGGTFEQVQIGILGSVEYFTTRGGGTNRGWLDAVYADVLGRAIDPTGLAGWTAALNAGASRTDVAQAILASVESNTRELQQLYQALLGRAGDAFGLAAFSAALNSGVSDEIVAAIMVGSQEYFQRACGTTA